LPGAPSAPKKSCPFCQGSAAFQLAIAPGSALSLLAPPPLAAVPTAIAAAYDGEIPGLPQSRGPPSFPA
jgi:hypothetical protein